MDGKVDVLVAGVGTGGTITGTGERLKERNPDLLVVAVEPEELGRCSPAGGPGRTRSRASGPASCRRCSTSTWSTRSSRSTTRTPSRRRAACARTEGVLAGMSCGAALWGAIEVGSRPEMRGKRIAVVLPDSGERYVSTPFFAPTM